VAAAGDPLLDHDWMRRKLELAGVNELIRDYERLPEDASCALLARVLRQAAHILALTILRDPQRALPWNRLFGRKAVPLNLDESPKEAAICADAKVHVISADEAHLLQLDPAWNKVCLEVG
jgi:hypothetical protein